MTIPIDAETGEQIPLELDVDVGETPIGELAWMDPSVTDGEYIVTMRRFLLNHATSWSRQQINALTPNDLFGPVAPMIFESLQDASVPEGSAPPSDEP